MTDLDRLFDLVAAARVPGGFGYLGSNGRVLPDRPLETWIVARMTHVAGLTSLLGRPGATRAVGSACGANPLLIVRPCHRVLRSDGGLGGYAGGLDAKRFLLTLEEN